MPKSTERTLKPPSKRMYGAMQGNLARTILLLFLLGVLFTYIESVSAISDFHGKGGENIWEPIVWSSTSVFTIVGLSAWIYKFTSMFPITQEHWLLHGLYHLGASVVFSIIHVVVMFSMRQVIYGIAGEEYRVALEWEVFIYEYSKDILSYFFIALISHLILIWRRMNQAHIKALTLEADLANLNLRRMQEQLRPHFLFNTLNHISSCMYEDVEKADGLLSDLSALLRYSLKEAHLITVPLKEELEFLRLYLNLMNHRFSGRIKTDFTIGAGVMEAQVPRFMLQPLVENAIQHGFQDRDGAGQIEIHISRHKDLLHIDVVDDGKGLDFQNQGGVVYGYGLGNILAILKQRNPDAAQLSLLPNPEGGLIVKIQLRFTTDPMPIASQGIEFSREA